MILNYGVSIEFLETGFSFAIYADVIKSRNVTIIGTFNKL